MSFHTWTDEKGREVWMVASRGVWLPGVYDSQRTARYAFRFTDTELESVAHIWRVDGEDRPATIDDLRDLRRRGMR